MAKKLKLTEDGKAALLGEDGNPILIDDAGKESPFDYQGALSRLRGLSDTNETLQKERDRLAGEADAFRGFGKSKEDIAEALRVVSGLDAKKLVDAGKVDQMVQERVDALVKKSTDAQAASEAREKATRNGVRNLLIKTAVLESKRGGILSKTNIPTRAAELMFADHFDLEESDGAFGLVPFRDPGRKEKFWNADGKVGSPEEALAEIVKNHPDAKDFMLGVNGSGGDAKGGAVATNNGKTLSRTQFMALPPTSQMAHVQAGGEITD